jgi:DNA excision repair protein ERCC-3
LGAPLRLCADGTALVRLGAPGAAEAERLLSPIAERGPRDSEGALYRMTEHSLWEAAARGQAPRAGALLDALAAASPLPLPEALVRRVEAALGRTAALTLRTDARGALWLGVADGARDVDLRSLVRTPAVRGCLAGPATPDRAPVRPDRRYALRAALLRLGYPLRDAGPSRPDGAPIAPRPGAPTPRPYQVAAVEAFGRQPGGGVVVLPCGSGKTLVGALAICHAGAPAVVVVPHHAAAQQWRRTVLEQAVLSPAEVSVYHGPGDVAPVTIVTYAMLASRARDGTRPHLRRLAGVAWALVVFDEVHLLPAPVFGLSAALPAGRRLGLSATLVREDGRQGEVLALVGPVVYAVDAAALVRDGHLASAHCVEVRVPLPSAWRTRYLRADGAVRLRLAAENPAKAEACERLLARHPEASALVLGQYLRQLEAIAGRLGAPLVTGRTPREERERIYAAFREGRIRRLVLSRVGTLALDLPEATVAVQVSGAFGSRQEEAQRLGRLLRPKASGASARFYSLVTAQSPEIGFAARRARYLEEQGYVRRIEEGAQASPEGAS